MYTVEYDYFFKILLIGDVGVGKSCLVSRFVDNSWTELHVNTAGVDFKIKTLMIDGYIVKLQIWDIAKLEKFRDNTEYYYRNARGILLVYDCTIKESFDNVKQWICEFNGYPRNIVILLVGTKSDLKKVISTEDAKKLAQQYFIPYIEVSAKTSHNVEECFSQLISDIYRTPKNEITQDKSTNSCCCFLS